MKQKKTPALQNWFISRKLQICSFAKEKFSKHTQSGLLENFYKAKAKMCGFMYKSSFAGQV